MNPQKKQSSDIEIVRQHLFQIQQGWQQAELSDPYWQQKMLTQLHALKESVSVLSDPAAAEACLQLTEKLTQHDSGLTPMQAVSVSRSLAKLHTILHHPDLDTNPPKIEIAKPEATVTFQTWQINFTPSAEFLATGGEPLKYLKQLSELGAATVSIDSTELPEFADFETDRCYLRWQIMLKSDETEAVIRHVFDNLSGNDELQVTKTVEHIEIDNDVPSTAMVTNEQQQIISDLLRRQQQQMAWLAELTRASEALSLPLQNRLEQLQLSQTQSYLDLQKLILKPTSALYQQLLTQIGGQSTIDFPQQTAWLPAPIFEELAVLLPAIWTSSTQRDPLETAIVCLPAEIHIEQSFTGMQLALNVYLAGEDLQTENLQKVIKNHHSVATAPAVEGNAKEVTDFLTRALQKWSGEIHVISVTAHSIEVNIHVQLRQTQRVLQAINVADQRYVVLPDSIVDDLPADSLPQQHVNGRGEYVAYRQQWLQVRDLRQHFRLSARVNMNSRLLIIRERAQQFAIRVDKLMLPAMFLLSDITRHYSRQPGILALATDGALQPALWLEFTNLFGPKK